MNLAFELEQSPWCTRAAAAGYLGFQDIESLDPKLTRSKTFEPGRIRYRTMADGAMRPKIRLWKADVLEMLKPFEG